MSSTTVNGKDATDTGRFCIQQGPRKVVSSTKEVTAFKPSQSTRNAVRSYSVVEDEPEPSVKKIWDIKNPEELDKEVHSRLKDLPSAALEFYKVLDKGPKGLGVEKYWGDTAQVEKFFLIPNRDISIPIGNRNKTLSFRDIYQLIEDFADRGVPINFQNPFLDWSKSSPSHPMVIVGGSELFKADKDVNYDNSNGTRVKMDIAGEFFNPQCYFDNQGRKRIHLLIPFPFNVERDRNGLPIDIYDSDDEVAYPENLKKNNNIKESTWIEFFANRFKVDPAHITVSNHAEVRLSPFEDPYKILDPEISRSLLAIVRDYCLPFAINHSGEVIFVLKDNLPGTLTQSINSYENRRTQLYKFADMLLVDPSHEYFTNLKPTLIDDDGNGEILYPEFRILTPDYKLTKEAAAMPEYVSAYQNEMLPKLSFS